MNVSDSQDRVRDTEIGAGGGSGLRTLPPTYQPPTYQPPTATSAPAAPTGGAGSTTGSLPGTLDQPMYPWLMPWEGPFAAPMTPQQNQAVSGMSSFAGNNFGLNSANNYLQGVMGGDYLDVANNPYFHQIQESGQALKQYNDADAIRRIQSSMAAGGNALSGASAGAQSDYMGKSNSGFQQMMAQLMANQYGQERGLQSQAASQSGNLAQIPMAGYTALAGLGSIGQDTAQKEISGQYTDFLRQGGAMRDQFQYPDYLSLQTLGRGYQQQNPNLFGASSASQLTDLLGMRGSSGSGTNYSDLIQQLLGYGSGSGSGEGSGSGGSGGFGSGYGLYGSGTNYDGVSYDATPTQVQKGQYQNWLASMGSGTTGATNYQDRLTAEIAKSNQPAPGSQASSATKTLAILSLIGQLLGTSSKSKSGKSGVGFGSSGSSGPPNTNKQPQGKTLFDLLSEAGHAIFDKKPMADVTGNQYGQPIGPNAYDPNSFMSDYGMGDTGYQGFGEDDWNQAVGNWFGESDFGFGNPDITSNYETFGDSGSIYGRDMGNQSFGFGNPDITSDYQNFGDSGSIYGQDMGNQSFGFGDSGFALPI